MAGSRLTIPSRERIALMRKTAPVIITNDRPPAKSDAVLSVAKAAAGPKPSTPGDSAA